MSESTLPAITISVLYDAPIEKVWSQIATSEGIAAWFMPNDFQPEKGHHFHLQSPLGPSPCQVLHVEPPYKMSFSWDTDGWIVTFELKETSGKTELTLLHDGWKRANDMVPKANQKQAVIHRTIGEGWEALLESNIRKLVEG
jgi:uncharacterized protein YndB with AHSA1/START domain